MNMIMNIVWIELWLYNVNSHSLRWQCINGIFSLHGRRYYTCYLFLCIHSHTYIFFFLTKAKKGVGSGYVKHSFFFPLLVKKFQMQIYYDYPNSRLLSLTTRLWNVALIWGCCTHGNYIGAPVLSSSYKSCSGFVWNDTEICLSKSPPFVWGSCLCICLRVLLRLMCFRIWIRDFPSLTQSTSEGPKCC